MANYQVIDAYGSVINIQSSTFGGVERQIVGASIIGGITTTPSGNQSVSGVVGASVIGYPAVNVGGSVVAFQGTTPWLIGSVYGNISGSVATTQIGTWNTSITSTVPSSVIVGASIFGQLPAGTAVLGSVATLQGTNPWVTSNPSGSVTQVRTDNASVITVWKDSSIITVGTNSASIYGMRNDAVASFLGADLTERPIAVDSAGRTLIKPFAAEEARIEGYASTVNVSVTTIVAAAGAGLKNYITDVILVNTGAAATLVTFKSGGGTSVIGYAIAPAGGGSNMVGMNMPWRTLANETVDFQATTATSVLYAKVQGYKAP